MKQMLLPAEPLMVSLPSVTTTVTVSSRYCPAFACVVGTPSTANFCDLSVAVLPPHDLRVMSRFKGFPEDPAVS